MKKLLLITTLFLSLNSFAQDLDTVIIKNNYTYKFMKTNSPGGLSMTNETTAKEFLELPKGKFTENDFQIESQRINEHMRSNSETNIFKSFLKIFKETFKDCELQKFNHTRSFNFFIAINSNGDIIDLRILLNKDFLNIVGYDKFIEFETRIRKEYKFKPFINQEMKKKHFITVRLNTTQLNEVFK